MNASLRKLTQHSLFIFGLAQYEANISYKAKNNNSFCLVTHDKYSLVFSMW